MVAQHSSPYFIFRMAFMAAMIVLGLSEVRVSIAGISRDPSSCPSDSPPGVIHALLIGVGQYPQNDKPVEIANPYIGQYHQSDQPDQIANRYNWTRQSVYNNSVKLKSSNKLLGPANDLALLSQTLLDKGIKPENITLLLDEQVTVKGVLAAIDKLHEKIQCGDQAFIHYSGVGNKDGLFTFETKIKSIKDEKYIGIISGDMLRKKIEDLKKFLL